jgi:hypothetical protein
MVRIDGKEVLAIAPFAAELQLLAKRLRLVPTLRRRLRIVPPEAIRAFLAARRHRALSHYAVHRLATMLPRFSARRLAARRSASPPSRTAAILALLLLAPSHGVMLATLALSLFFLNCGLWRMAAALHRPTPLRLAPLSSERLPTYTLLVPLYREAAVVPDLLAGLGDIDYPASKLQIVIILEADDRESRAAVMRHAASPTIEIVIVPPGGPRTKPKALTYALAFARGDMVVVYDAEDRPEPDQLRRAAAAFAERPDLGCVQARLLPDNDDSWLARMFAVEYAANFEILLPALASFRAPLPLGGTSNHFPRAVLEKVGGWDPFNVTEDADLGVRLARFGYQTATIVSRTYEEAPVHFRQWLPQRRRWIKGWMQTVLLGIAGPAPAGLRLSPAQTLAVHGVLTAGVLGLLLYPGSLALIAAAALAALRGDLPSGALNWALLALNGANLALVAAAAAISAWRGLSMARARRLAVLIPLLPLYWALMSLAAWQAFARLMREPWRWEKTEHGVARMRARPAAKPLAPRRPHAAPQARRRALQKLRELHAREDRPARRAGERLRRERQAG